MTAAQPPVEPPEPNYAYRVGQLEVVVEQLLLLALDDGATSPERRDAVVEAARHALADTRWETGDV